MKYGIWPLLGYGKLFLLLPYWASLLPRKHLFVDHTVCYKCNLILTLFAVFEISFAFRLPFFDFLVG